jgi:transcription elongation factor GreA
LKKELEFRKNVRKKEINDILSAAIEKGDLSENDEYNMALEESLSNDSRIDELGEIIKNAQVLEACPNTDTICLGHTVTIKSDDNKELTVTLVGDTEANPLEKKISSTSPMGKELYGKSKGDKIKITTPAGETQYTIVSIK